MLAKALEIRDHATFIPVLAVDMNPGFVPVDSAIGELFDTDEGQRYLLRRAGYACDGQPMILLTRLKGSRPAHYDPYEWGDRTFATAHRYIIEHWGTLTDGDVVDVEFILDETKAPKVSERYTAGHP